MSVRTRSLYRKYRERAVAAMAKLVCDRTTASGRRESQSMSHLAGAFWLLALLLGLSLCTALVERALALAFVGIRLVKF